MLQKSCGPRLQEDANDRRKTTVLRGKEIAKMKGKHNRQVPQDGVFAKVAKLHSFCFSYQLPSPTHAAITPPASQVFQPLQEDQEAYEDKTMIFREGC